MSKSSIGKKKGRSWSLSSSAASSISISPATTTHTSTLLLTPNPSPSPPHCKAYDPFAAVAPVTPVAPVSATDDAAPSSPPSPPSPHSPNSTFGRLSSFKRKMARPIQRSYSQSHAHGQYSISSSSNHGLGQGATVVRTPMDATAHMQHASISYTSSAATQSRQKCTQYPHRQSSLRSANGSPMNGASARRPSVGSAAPAQSIPRAPRIEPSLEGPAFEEEKVEIQFMRTPKTQPRKPYQTDQSADWSHHAPSSTASTQEQHQSLQFPSNQTYQQYHQPPSRQSSQKALAQKYAQHAQHGQKPSVSISYAPAHVSVSAVGAYGAPGLVRSLSSQSALSGHSGQSGSASGHSSASCQTPLTPRTPPTPRTPEPERPERTEGDALDIDIAYHRHRLTSGTTCTGRSSMTITAENAATSLGSHHSSSLGSSHGHGSYSTHGTQPLQVHPTSLRTHRSHTSLAPSLAPSPSPRAHAPSPSVASFASTIDEEVSPRLPNPMPRRRPSQTSKPDGPFSPVVVGHQIRPSTESSTLVTLRFAFSLDTDPNTHTVTLTLDTLRPAGGRLVQFVEDALRPYSASSASLIGSGESVNSVYSTAAYEGANENGPDMTDGSSAESAEDGDSDFEYDPNPSYQFFQEEYLEVMEETERVSPIPALRPGRRAPLSSCPTPLPPLAELPSLTVRPRATPSPSPHWPSSASYAHSNSSHSYTNSGWSGSASVSRENSQRSVTSSVMRRKRASTCPSASGVVTELTVLLQRDASAWHAIASRLCSGTWPLLDGRRKRVETECKWAGMAGLAQELERNPHFVAGYL